MTKYCFFKNILLAFLLQQFALKPECWCQLYPMRPNAKRQQLEERKSRLKKPFLSRDNFYLCQTTFAYVVSSYVWYNLQIYNTCWTSQNKKTPTRDCKSLLHWVILVPICATLKMPGTGTRESLLTPSVFWGWHALLCSWSMEERLLIADIDPLVVIAVKTLFKLIMLMTEGWGTA